MNKTWQRLLAAMMLTLVTSVGIAATPDTVPEENPQSDIVEPQIWRVDGGDLRMRFNEGFLDLLGIDIRLSAAVRDKQNPEFSVFPLLSLGGLSFNAPDGAFAGFEGGELTLRGGVEIRLADGSAIDLRNAALRPSKGHAARLELVGADGQAWIYVNHLMYEFGQNFRYFEVRSSDMRASPALAKRVGEAALADAYIGELQLSARIIERSREITARPKGNVPNFHGTPHPSGGIFEADVLLTDFNMEFMRCRRSNGTTNDCDGVGADNGEVVFAPNATLRNGNTSRTADIPWYRKFTGETNTYGYPYPNADQHPYLIWNAYRIADGQLEQIGASGTKHAYLTTNVGCAPDAFMITPGHILGRNCADTYSTGNNDSVGDLGPRPEILPASGEWGRCGSVFDTNCDGTANGVSACPTGNPTSAGCYSQRMVIRESQMQVPGAAYFSEAWYVVQDDINIYNTMGRRSMTPIPDGAIWLPTAQGSFTRGPVINAWVDPSANPTSNIELNSSAGRARAAVKVKTLAACPAASGLFGTCYRYDYAVHNFDFATAESTSGALPNLRVTGAKGFDSFKITLPARTNVFVEPDVNFADTDINPANNWTANVTAGAVEWTAPVDNALNWGTLYRFSLVSDAAPTTDLVSIDLGVANPRPGLLALEGNMVGPAGLGNGIMKNGFE